MTAKSVPADVIGRVELELKQKLPHSDVWCPDSKSQGGFFDQSGRSPLRTPLLLADDGNLLLAVMSAVRADSGASEKPWSRFANEGVRVLGNVLHRAAIDYGMHRLLLLLILPEGQDVAESLSAELAQARYTAGQFRVVMLPCFDQDVSEFQKQLEQRLDLLNPFPQEAFFKPVSESDLVDYVQSAFDGGAHESNSFRALVEKDVREYLQAGSWASDDGWPHSNQAVDGLVRTALERKGL